MVYILQKIPAVPCNHCEGEENGIEEEEPEATSGSVVVAVKAHNPVVALERSRQQYNQQSEERVFVLPVEDEAGHRGDLRRGSRMTSSIQHNGETTL